jgi:hypothetical protein
LAVEGINSSLGILGLFKLDIGIATAFLAVRIGLQFARNNVTESRELVINLLLGYFLVNVLDKQVSLLLKLGIRTRLDDSEGITHESLVIHLS